MFGGGPGGPGAGGPGGPGGQDPFWESVKQVNLDEQGTIFLLFNMPDFIEDDDMNMIKKNYPVVIRNALLGTALGITANVQLKRIPNFLRWNRFLRFGLRIPTFFLPFGLFYKDTERRVVDLQRSLQKYQRRFLNFQKTGDAKYLDPDRKLAKKAGGQIGL